MKTKLLKRLTIAALALIATTSLPANIKADTNSTSHTLNASYVVYGAGTATEVRSKLADVLGTDSNFKTLTATASDYSKYIGNGATTTDAAMISSVAIAPSDPGSGVKVNIKKYDGQDNITQVTAQQYAMVAQMAGVNDVTIVVTANRAVSGESALTGVYKALAQDGITLNTTDTATANQMLDATQQAINENKDDSAYAGKLMAAVGDTTKEIAKQKQDGQTLTREDIQQLLNEALQKHDIANQTSQNAVNNIINVLIKFENSPISLSKDYLENVTNTIDNVKNSTGDLMNKVKDWANSDAAKETVQKAKNIFTQFIEWIKSFFN